MKLKPNPMKTDQTKETRATAETAVYGSEEMLTPAPPEFIPQHKTTPEIAYRMVKDETYSQTQPRLNLATFVTTYMDDYATKLMNDAININYIDETACGGYVRPLHKHPCQPVAYAREECMEGRCRGYRIVGGVYVGRRGGMAAVACQTQEGG